MVNKMNGPVEELSIFRNLKGREYVGTKFNNSPRPQRHKIYEGPYSRLKTSVFNSTDDSIIPKTGLSILERILLTSFGVTSVKFYGYQSEMLWSFPSAGACYPVEAYVIVRSLDGVEPGVYHYSALNTSLHKISCSDALFLLEGTILPDDLDASFYIVISTIPWRSCWKYSHRGYRFTLIDAGHVIANYQSVLNSMGFHFSTYTAFKSQHLKTLLNIDRDEDPVSIIAVQQSSFAIGNQVIENLYDRKSQNLNRCVTSVDSDSALFDWTPINKFRENVKSSLAEPTEQWRTQYNLPAEWNDYNEMLRLIIERRSSSSYLPVEIPRHDLIKLMEFINGLNMPIRTYCIIHSVEGMIPGLYELNGQLKMIKAGDYRSKSAELCLGQELVHDASVLFFFAVDHSQITEKNFYTYQQKLIDVGILGQMIYLKSHELKLGYSAIGGYYDDDVKTLLQLDEQMEIVYSGTLGKDDLHSAFKVKRDRHYLNKPQNDMEINMDKAPQYQWIIDKLHKAVEEFGEKVAIQSEGKVYTYSEFWNQVVLSSSWLKQRIPKKYPVGISMKNCSNYLFVYYGLLLEGYIPMLIDHTFTQDEIDSLCSYYDIGSILTLNENGEVQVELREEQFDSFQEDSFANVATCRFSSGTTGRPKCLMFTHDAVINAGVNWAKASNITSEDRVLCTALFHNGLAFNTSLLAVFVSGATLYIHRQITPKSIWNTVVNEKITILVAFPVAYDLLNQSKFCENNHTLRICLSSAAPLHHTVRQDFYNKVGIEICDYYGIVEAGPVTFNDGSQEHSLGLPVPGVDIRIVDEEGASLPNEESGLIQVRSSSMAKGYYKATFPFVVSPDGYYQTTDRGFLKNNYLYINGRTSEMINVAGKKVDPLEVENVLMKLKGIRDVAVVGMMNERKTTEYPIAFIVSESDVSQDQIIAHCQLHLAPFKLPQKFIKVLQIPRSGVGKIKRQELINTLTVSN
ncbi:AMP-binding protein [Paenibacillus sp. IHBB 10380]|uniref:AMP-binding protein n=1 Tax=Paenibacillus sp. IHBB 10380 TaxID=1566358 RepID=UPI0005CFCBA0|nr:AMP-binding protein [Paenibacillus sp. IHBB 10380]AJS60190.1 dehydrogenase [Paenibacillus sp. IHBB 10380]